MIETATDIKGSQPEPAANAKVIALVAVIAASLAGLYWDTVESLIRRWSQDDNYGHGFIVPIVSGYLAWQAIVEGRKQKRSVENPRGGIILGMILIAFGTLLSFVTLVFSSIVAGGISLVIVIAGLTMMIGGWQWWAKLWAPIAFLLFMVPLPSPVHSMIAFPLQLFVSQVSAMTLEVFSIPVMRDGNLIHLPGQTMHVAEACSGLRQLMAFLAVCACAALIIERPLWYRILLFLSSIPIAIVVNIIRVTAMGFLIHAGKAELTQGWLHTAEGLIMVAIGLGFLMIEMSVIDWLLVPDPKPENSNLPVQRDQSVLPGGLYRQITPEVS